jgi:hypothetical protein
VACLMNGELEMTYKEAAMTCFAVLYQHSSGDTEKNSHYFFMVVGVHVEIRNVGSATGGMDGECENCTHLKKVCSRICFYECSRYVIRLRWTCGVRIPARARVFSLP